MVRKSVDPLWMGAEKEERPEQVVCFPAGAETVELDLEKRRESDALKLTHLLLWPVWPEGDSGCPGSLCELAAETQGSGGEGGCRRRSAWPAGDGGQSVQYLRFALNLLILGQLSGAVT